MHFTTNLRVPHGTQGNDGYWVFFVRYPLVIWNLHEHSSNTSSVIGKRTLMVDRHSKAYGKTNLSINESCPLWITHPRFPVCDPLDCSPRGEIERQEYRFEFSKCAPERVADLLLSPYRVTGMLFCQSSEIPTTVTLLVLCSAISLLTSLRIIRAVLACSSANPLCTRTFEATPGKRVESRDSRGMLRSVMSEYLRVRGLGSAQGWIYIQVGLQFFWVCSLVGHHDGILRGPVPDVI